MLDYTNMAASFRVHDQIIHLDSLDTSLCFLPLSHIFERAWSFYLLARGATNVYLKDPHQVSEALKTIKGSIAKGIVIVYLIMTAFCSYLYFPGGMTGFEAINHAMTTVSTGGYSTSVTHPGFI